MTEDTGCFQWPLYQPKLDDIPFYADIAPVGKVNQGTHVKIVDDANRPTARNQTGELHICSPGLAQGYQGGIKPEDFYVDNGKAWFKTGDIGLINDDAWIHILGRKKDVIKRAGVTIRSAALQSALNSLLNTETSVFAVPDPILGQEAFAVVRSLNGLTKQEVIQHILDLFGEASPLRGVATLSDLNITDFPINPSDKILKRELEVAVGPYLHP